MRVPRIARTALGATLRFFLPWACAGCRTPLGSIVDSGFCGVCWLRMPRIDGLVCQACGVPLKDGGNQCFSCREKPTKLLIRAAATFHYPLQPAVHRFKYAGRKTLQPLFKLLMDYAWNRYPELGPVDTLVPVPLHPSTGHDRGYNQAALLAQALSPIAHCPVRTDLIVRTRKTTPQYRLSKTERLTNLTDAFGLAPGISSDHLKGQHILLIDDVCTTGATLRACSDVLKSAGTSRVKALVLARDI